MDVSTLLEILVYEISRVAKEVREVLEFQPSLRFWNRGHIQRDSKHDVAPRFNPP